MNLLQQLCSIQAPSGDEEEMTRFIVDYVKKNKKNWKISPKIFSGKGFQDCVVLVFGKPRTAIFAHMDSIGYSVRYGKELVKVGGPRNIHHTSLVGRDSKGKIDCKLVVKKGKHGDEISYQFKREIDRGTYLTFKPNFRETKDFIQSPYMDDRLGMYNALKVAETLKNGIIVFSCWEEHGGGSVEYISKFIYEKYGVDQALISDITWVTSGVRHGAGVAISMRDSLLPRRSYVDRIIAIAKKSKIHFQFEVESAGGSDGGSIQRSPYPIDWCFIGPPEDHVHTADEKVHKKDIETFIDLYKVLMKEL